MSRIYPRGPAWAAPIRDRAAAAATIAARNARSRRMKRFITYLRDSMTPPKLRPRWAGVIGTAYPSSAGCVPR